MVDETINICDELGNSKLYYAVENNDLLATARLLRLGAKQTVNEDSENPLMCAIKQPKLNLSIVKLLLNNIEVKDFELRDNQGKNILHLASESGNDELLIMLLKNEKFHKRICRYQIEAKDQSGKVPSDYAQNEKIAKVLEGIKAGQTLQQIQDGEFINGHKRLIQYVNELGYKFDEEGICFGLSHMGLQAILLKDTELFNERLHLLMKTPPEELNLKITQARAKYNIFGNDLMDELNKAEKEGIITKEERKTYDNLLDFSEAVKAQAITQEEKLLLEIPAFVEGMLLYFQPSHYPDIVGSSAFTQDAMLSAPFVLSKEIEKQQGMAKKASFSGIYNNNELKDYFNSLEEAIKNSDPLVEHPFGLSLNNVFHAITIGYDNTRENKWIFIDATHLPATYYSSVDEIVKKVQEGFYADSYDSVAFKTDLYVTKENSKEFSHSVKAWKNSKEYKSIHKISDEKANRFDSVSANWLTVAAKAGLTEVVKNLLAVKEMKVHYHPTRMVLNEALIAAAEWGRSDIVQALLEEGVDPNMEIAGVTPLTIAVQNGQLEVVRILLKAEGIEPVKPNMKGETPLDIATKNNNKPILDVLKAKEQALKKSEQTPTSNLPEGRKKIIHHYNSSKSESPSVDVENLHSKENLNPSIPITRKPHKKQNT